MPVSHHWQGTSDYQDWLRIHNSKGIGNDCWIGDNYACQDIHCKGCNNAKLEATQISKNGVLTPVCSRLRELMVCNSCSVISCW